MVCSITVPSISNLCLIGLLVIAIHFVLVLNTCILYLFAAKLIFYNNFWRLSSLPITKSQHTVYNYITHIYHNIQLRCAHFIPLCQFYFVCYLVHNCIKQHRPERIHMSYPFYNLNFIKYIYSFPLLLHFLYLCKHFLWC